MHQASAATEDSIMKDLKKIRQHKGRSLQEEFCAVDRATASEVPARGNLGVPSESKLLALP